PETKESMHVCLGSTRRESTSAGETKLGRARILLKNGSTRSQHASTCRCSKVLSTSHSMNRLEPFVRSTSTGAVSASSGEQVRCAPHGRSSRARGLNTEQPAMPKAKVTNRARSNERTKESGT